MELFIAGGLDTCISQGRGVEELINTLSLHLVFAGKGVESLLHTFFPGKG